MTWEEDPDSPWAKVRKALGSLVMLSGQLEHTVESMAMNLANGPTWNRTLLLVGDLGTGQMAERVRRLSFTVLDGTIRDDVVGWLERVKQVQAARNDLVHAHWSGGIWSEDGTKHGVFAHTTNVRKAKEGVRRDLVDVTPEDVKAIARTISQLEREGLELIVELQELGLAERLHEHYGPRSELLPKWRRAGDAPEEADQP